VVERAGAALGGTPFLQTMVRVTQLAAGWRNIVPDLLLLTAQPQVYGRLARWRHACLRRDTRA
jgi:hypothetical protein